MSADRAQNSRNANTVPAWVNQQAPVLQQMQWSPEQIFSRLPARHETVYQHVYAEKAQGGTLWKNLPRQKQKSKRYAGWWPRYPTKDADWSVLPFMDKLKPLASSEKTLTFGNGKEFARHAYIDKQLQSIAYFARQFANWEPGSNENFKYLTPQ